MWLTKLTLILLVRNTKQQEKAETAQSIIGITIIAQTACRPLETCEMESCFCCCLFRSYGMRKS